MAKSEIPVTVAVEGTMQLTLHMVVELWHQWFEQRQAWEDIIPFTIAELQAMKKISEGVGELNNIRGDSFDRHWGDLPVEGDNPWKS